VGGWGARAHVCVNLRARKGSEEREALNERGATGGLPLEELPTRRVVPMCVGACVMLSACSEACTVCQSTVIRTDLRETPSARTNGSLVGSAANAELVLGRPELHHDEGAVDEHNLPRWYVLLCEQPSATTSVRASRLNPLSQLGSRAVRVRVRHGLERDLRAVDHSTQHTVHWR
jgi:hypothetical protein